MPWSEVLQRIGRSIIQSQLRQLTTPRRKSSSPRQAKNDHRAPGASNGTDYPGDFTGTSTVQYDPHPGDLPDPGEVVWTWVPYEEDHHQGKDRPVLIVGREGQWLLALMLTSRDHDERSDNRHWIDIGSGPWDSRRRPSEVRLDRVLRVAPHSVRRAGMGLAQDRFDQVARCLRDSYGWH
ncbi:MAG: type II toxin-antitoxin system PemK/MazF family toxin [Actinomycetota bacterium]